MSLIALAAAIAPNAYASSTTGGKKSIVWMRARSSATRYTAASSGAPRPTSKLRATSDCAKFVASKSPARGRKTCASSAAPSFDAQPAHAAYAVRRIFFAVVINKKSLNARIVKSCRTQKRMATLGVVLWSEKRDAKTIPMQSKARRRVLRLVALTDVFRRLDNLEMDCRGLCCTKLRFVVKGHGRGESGRCRQRKAFGANMQVLKRRGKGKGADEQYHQQHCHTCADDQIFHILRSFRESVGRTPHAK